MWLAARRLVLWSDIPNNRILAWDEREGGRVWRDRVEFTNGHTACADGSLLHCSHGMRAILRTRFDGDGRPGTPEVLVDRYQGRRLNSPNDLVEKRDGSIWFTDPPTASCPTAKATRRPPSCAPTTCSATTRPPTRWTSPATSPRNPTAWRSRPTKACCT